MPVYPGALISRLHLKLRMDDKKSISELLQRELDYRRTKQWNIFSWSSGTLVAITCAMVALQRTTPLPTSQRLPVATAVAALAIYSFIWLEYNSTQEKRTAERLKEESGWYVRGDNPPPGFRGAVVILAIAAQFATWYPVCRHTC